MERIKKQEYFVGLLMLVCGLSYMAMTSQLPTVKNQYGVVDASFVPYVLSAIMCVLGVLQLATVRKLKVKASEEAAAASTDNRSVIKTIALITIYIALLEPIGFLIATVLYLVVQFTILTPHDKKPSLPLYLLIAVLTSVITYLTFRYGFDMVLPVGIFGL